MNIYSNDIVIIHDVKSYLLSTGPCFRHLPKRYGIARESQPQTYPPCGDRGYETFLAQLKTFPFFNWCLRPRFYFLGSANTSWKMGMYFFVASRCCQRHRQLPVRRPEMACSAWSFGPLAYCVVVVFGLLSGVLLFKTVNLIIKS